MRQAREGAGNEDVSLGLPLHVVRRLLSSGLTEILAKDYLFFLFPCQRQFSQDDKVTQGDERDKRQDAKMAKNA